MPNIAPNTVGFKAAAQKSQLAVAAAAIFDAQGRVLISRRLDHLHQGGLWEFPGGKLEPGEDSRQALQRELREELGIEVRRARPLIRIEHDYPDRCVVLHVWRVDAFSGQAYGQEGQPVAWVSPQELTERAFPAANLPIISAVRLPDRYLITPERGGDLDEFLRGLEQSLQEGISLVQLRATSLSTARYQALAKEALKIAGRNHARLLLNADPCLVEELGADGVHLNGARLRSLKSRPLAEKYWVAASCHNLKEIEHAQRIGVDFLVLSPVLPTTSHPAAEPLGWKRFTALAEQARVPVFALGGMEPEHLSQALYCGAQGIAAIRGLWGISAS